jgi:hypothetical protein
MSYQIFNSGASIRFTDPDGEVMIYKQTIRQIAVIGDGIIKIDTGEKFRTIFFRHENVSVPVSGSAVALTSVLNNWLTDCLCTPSTPPME